MKLVSNWSFFMLPIGERCIITVQRIDLLTLSRIIDTRDIKCFISNPALVRFLNSDLGSNFVPLRDRFILDDCEQIIVAQYCGPKFSLTTKEMPDVAKFVFFLVKLMPHDSYVVDDDEDEIPDFNMFDLGDVPKEVKTGHPVDSRGYSNGNSSP